MTPRTAVADERSLITSHAGRQPGPSGQERHRRYGGIHSESDTRYEVELQLGATDESHLIRTIEY